MEEKVIYDNGNSKLTARFDGEIVELEQDGPAGLNSLYMYIDELIDVINFVNQRKGDSE